MNIKQVLYNLCVEFVNHRLQTIEAIILSNQNALQSETKSSAGDKHETGRAMLQLEMEKAGQQLSVITQMKEVLSKINISKTATHAHLGSVIITDKNNFFLSISSGELKIDNKNYFAVSTHSPIGKLLLGKQTGNVVIWNGNSMKILKVW